MSNDDAVKIPSGLSGVGGWLDDRFHGAKGVRVLMRKVFPDHWTFMLGEIALWSFVILLLTGTYLALAISSASQPDWYLGILEGALRVMPAWEINFLGHTLSLSVLIPALLPLGIIFTGAALWPFFEQWATGDKSFHNINDRPRNAPVRTGIGVAAVCFYAVLLL